MWRLSQPTSSHRVTSRLDRCFADLPWTGKQSENVLKQPDHFMSELDRRFWPFRPRASVAAAITLLVGLWFIVALVRTFAGWPSANSEQAVLIGVLVLSVLPILLAVLDVSIDRGAVLEYKGVKIDFSRVHGIGMRAVTVPVNIGVRGQSVTDSSTTQILDALRQATSCDVAIVDLEEGQAWWETRLLVLLAGAERLKRPEKIVFVGTDAGRSQRFQGWAHAPELLRQLLQAHPQYLRSFQAARAAARQWDLVEPTNPVLPGQPVSPPPQPLWISGRLATAHGWMAFDGATGLRNEMLAEQLLASDLGDQVESGNAPTKVDLIRLQTLFKPVLATQTVDQSWPADRQMSALLDGDATYIAATQDGKYLTMTSRLQLLSEVLSALVEKRTA